jgi:hypothetical protein
VKVVSVRIVLHIVLVGTTMSVHAVRVSTQKMVNSVHSVRALEAIIVKAVFLMTVRSVRVTMQKVVNNVLSAHVTMQRVVNVHNVLSVLVTILKAVIQTTVRSVHVSMQKVASQEMLVRNVRVQPATIRMLSIA